MHGSELLVLGALTNGAAGSIPWSELFVVGSLWFWVLLLVEAVLLIVLIEWDKGLFATITLVVTLCLLQFLGNVNVLGFFTDHPIYLVVGIIGYFALGTLWSVARWWLYVREQRYRYDEIRSEFCQQHNLDGVISEDMQQPWAEHLAALGTRNRTIEVRPRARQHRGRILMWMVYWPWSCAWTVLHDPVRKAFKLIFHHIHDYLQEISDNAFKGVDEDFPKGKRKVADAQPAPTNGSHPEAARLFVTEAREIKT